MLDDILPELHHDISNYILVGEMISANTSKERIEQMIAIRSHEISSKYLWFPIIIRTNINYMLRVLIVGGEYITDVTLYNADMDDIIGRWNIRDDVEKRDPLELPSLNSLPSKAYGPLITVSQVGRSKNLKILEYPNDMRLKATSKIVVTQDEWNRFLLGDNTLNIPRIQFLDYNIIEKLCSNITYNADLIYYKILDIFYALYNMGYWSYGLFKDYKKVDVNLENVVYNRAGNIRGIKITTDKNGQLTNDSKKQLEEFGVEFPEEL